jgi:diguanylate cyclase (GGDEF)-like protein/PAS domain S-box-containing protein
MRYFVLFAILLFLALGYKTYEQYQHIIQTEKFIILNEGKALAHFIRAFRHTYQDAFVKNHIEINEKTISLLPVITIGEISARFSDFSKGNIVVRTVSDRPRNPKNKANPFEMETIAYFRKHPDKSYLFVRKDNSYHFTQPLRIKPSCLTCHGKREEALPSIRENYDTAYDYEIGQIRGLMNIRLQEKEIFAVLYRDFVNTLMITFALYLLFLLVIYLLIRKMQSREEKYTEELEQEIRQKTAELQSQKDSFETLFEKSSDGILIYADNKCIQCNEKIVAMLRFDSKEDLLETQPMALSPEYQPDGRKSEEKMSEILQSVYRDGEQQIEWLHRRKTNEEFLMEVTLSPIELNGQEVVYAVCRDISEKKKTQEKLIEQTNILHYQAHHDMLTELPNRNMFTKQLKHCLKEAKKRHHPLALFYIDLDQFKQINDSMGHEIGDRVLKITAKRLRSVTPDKYLLARLGGDEFTIILDPVADDDSISRLAQAILDTLSQAIVIDDQRFYLGGSIGISLYPRDGMQAHDLLKYADAAMYKAKEAGGNSYYFYSAEMTEQAYQRVVMKTALRRALDDEEFLVYYQPQIDARDGRLVGVEALVRWQHPLLGIREPADFLPIAKESKILPHIDRWVIRKALAEIREWIDAGLFDGRLAVNLTISHLDEEDFCPSIESILQESGIDPDRLEMEIAEDEVMNNYDEAVVKLKTLNEIGINIAIDDFGTGHSSLAYLKRLPVNKLKIDRSFIRDLPDDEEDIAIVKAIIALTRTLGLDIIAEGVETVEQKAFLIENECYLIQGYYYARPMPSEELYRRLVQTKGKMFAEDR